MYIYISNYATVEFLQNEEDDHYFDSDNYTWPNFQDAIATDSTEEAAGWIQDQKAAVEQEVLERLESNPDQPSLLPEPEVTWEDDEEWDCQNPNRQSRESIAIMNGEHVATMVIVRLWKEPK